MKTIETKNTHATNDPNREATMKKNAKKTVKHTTTRNETEEATMKKETKKKTPHTTEAEAAASVDTQPASANGSPTAPVTAPAPNAVSTQLQALEQSCGYGDPLTDDVRVASEELIRRVPTTIVARVIALAVRGGGTVAGVAFDPVAATAALAQANEADAVATSAQMLAARAKDQAIRLRAGVTGNASAIRIALRGLVKTPQGAPLAQENNELRSLAKQHAAARKARNTRTAKAVKDAVSLAQTPGGAPAPAPEIAPTPAGASSMAPPPTPKGS